MPAIITNDLRIFNADAFQTRVEEIPTYAFIAKETAWADEQQAPTPVDATLDKTELHKNLLAVKRVGETSIKSVIPRYDWLSGEVYDEFDHRVNMIDDKSDVTGNFRRFYVLTDEFNVYKCISNNGAVASTVKPTGSPITSFQTGDGYVWKFMFTLKAIDVFSFLTNDWMPCYTLEVNDGSLQWQIQETAVDGSIEHIALDNGGANYSAATPPDVVITGDGTGATAVAVVNAQTGQIARIDITSIGQGYTQASVAFQNTSGGIGAAATAILSPIGGHGKDAKSELGAIHKMVRIELSGNEGGTFPISSYRQAGLISLPLSTDIGSQLFFTDNSGRLFAEGETLTGQTSGATGTVRYIDPDGLYVYVSSVAGAFLQTEAVQNITGAEATISDTKTNVNLPEISVSVAAADIENRTGKFLYIANRTAINRTAEQVEDVKFIISF